MSTFFRARPTKRRHALAKAAAQESCSTTRGYYTSTGISEGHPTWGYIYIFQLSVPLHSLAASNGAWVSSWSP